MDRSVGCVKSVLTVELKKSLSSGMKVALRHAQDAQIGSRLQVIGTQLSTSSTGNCGYSTVTLALARCRNIHSISHPIYAKTRLQMYYHAILATGTLLYW